MAVRHLESAAEADRHDFAYWQQFPETERVLQVWCLGGELGGPRVNGEMNPDFVDLLRAFVAADV